MKLLLVLVACYLCAVLATTEPLVKVAHYEPVLNFAVNDARNTLTFMAYGRVWEFRIWLTDVYIGNNDHFHGRLVDNIKSSASFSLLPHSTTGMIIFKNDTLWLESRREDTETNPAGSMFIYKSSDVHFHPSVHRPACGAHEGHRVNYDGIPQRKETRFNHVTAVIKDQYWADPNNNPWADDGNTYGLLNDVNNVYASAGINQFTFQITGQRDNAWTQNSQLSNMLNDFSQWAQGNINTQQFTTAAWLVGNNVGGLAWLNVACRVSDPFHQTSVSGLANFSRLWTVKTIAHELGHNRGAPHDFDNQCNQGQGSGCQCSVMSYCFPEASTFGGAVNYFSQTSINAMQSYCS